MEKYKILLEIPMGAKAKLTQASKDKFAGVWQVGTVVVRGTPTEYIGYTSDDQYSVAFTFPDGDYHYLENGDFELIENDPEQSLEDRVKTLEQTVQDLQSQLQDVASVLYVITHKEEVAKSFVNGLSNSKPLVPVPPKPINNFYKFKHIRNVESFFNYETPMNFGGITLAYQELSDGSYKVGIALCSNNDNFNRETGRKIAIKRLNQSLYIIDQLEMSELTSVGSVGEFWELMDWDEGPSYITDRLVESCLL